MDFVGVLVGVFAAALGLPFDLGVPLALGVGAGSGDDPAMVSAIVHGVEAKTATMTMTMTGREIWQRRMRSRNVLMPTLFRGSTPGEASMT